MKTIVRCLPIICLTTMLVLAADEATPVVPAQTAEETPAVPVQEPEAVPAQPTEQLSREQRRAQRAGRAERQVRREARRQQNAARTTTGVTISGGEQTNTPAPIEPIVATEPEEANLRLNFRSKGRSMCGATSLSPKPRRSTCSTAS
jgi:hypothetical protein